MHRLEEKKLKKLDLAQTLHLLGTAGVIAGILLLVYELSQNREMMRAQTRTAVQQGFNEWIYNSNADLETSSIMERGNRGDQLSSAEMARYYGLKIAQIRYYENVHYQYRIGLYDDDEFVPQREAWRSRTMNNVGTRRIFCLNHEFFSPDFVAEMEALLQAPCE